MHSLLGKGDQTSCEFRTAHDVMLWPVQLTEARYFACPGRLHDIDLAHMGGVKAALRLRLRAGAGLAVGELALDRLPLYVRGSDALPSRIMEQLLSSAAGILVMPAQGAAWHESLPRTRIRALGCDDDEALLPTGPRSFQGYRLLQEYFALPQRYMFVELGGLNPALRRCAGEEVDIVVLFRQLDPALEQAVGAANFGLHCTPAINLFPKRADRVHLSDQQSDYHVVPDRTRPMDYEVCQVLGVTAYGSGADAEQTFRSFYTANDLQQGEAAGAYYQLRREPRQLSERQRRQGPRSSYIGSELFLSLVDAAEAPYRSSLRQLGVDTLCSNRDLVLSMPVGSGKTDFTIESGAPVASVRCVAGPTLPMPSHAEGETAWRLVGHLSLNYLSLVDQDAREGAAALRDLLRLYCGNGDAAALRQIDGVRSVTAEAVVRRLPVAGPISYGRGMRISVTLDDAAFEGSGTFVLGAVLERFFAKYVTLNAFTETVIRSIQRGDIMTWPARVGRCEIL
jgi:type VI secretion system protein ImpG